MGRDRGRSWLILLAGAIALATGTTIVLGTIVIGSFSRADAGQAATDLVRREMTPEGLARQRADFEIATAAVEELYAEALPAIAAELGESPEAFNESIEVRYPAVAEFLSPERREEAYAFAEGILTNLEEHQADFEEADAIPVAWMPMDLGPWLAVVLGGILAVAGVATLLRSTRLALGALTVLGLTLVVGPIVTRFPQKAAAATDLLDSLTITQELVAETRDIKDSADAAIEELESDLFPDVASGLGLSTSELDAFVDAQFPAIARARPQFDDILRRYEERVRLREVGIEVIPVAADYPLTAIAWWSVALGSLTALSAGPALLGIAFPRRRRDDGFERA